MPLMIVSPCKLIQHFAQFIRSDAFVAKSKSNWRRAIAFTRHLRPHLIPVFVLPTSFFLPLLGRPNAMHYACSSLAESSSPARVSGHSLWSTFNRINSATCNYSDGTSCWSAAPFVVFRAFRFKWTNWGRESCKLHAIRARQMGWRADADWTNHN